jgi:hypothetical protein
MFYVNLGYITSPSNALHIEVSISWIVLFAQSTQEPHIHYLTLTFCVCSGSMCYGCVDKVHNKSVN